MDELGLAAVIFPAAADVGPEDAERNPESHALAWRNGVWVSNGNVVIRHLGIPTVTVPMGVMADIGMPVGLTFAGRGYDDTQLLALATAFEASRRRRIAPPTTPALVTSAGAMLSGRVGSADLDVHLDVHHESGPSGELLLRIEGWASFGEGTAELQLSVNGTAVPASVDGRRFTAEAVLPAGVHDVPHSVWREPYGSIVVAVVKDARGAAVGAMTVVGGIA
jgi:amidase